MKKSSCKPNITGSGVSVGEGVTISPTAIILGSTRGTRVVIGDNCQIYDYVVIQSVGGNGDITIGKFCYINPFCVLYSGNGITIGDSVLIAAGVKIMPTNHSFSSRDIDIRCQGFAGSKGGVTVGDDVWIGANAVLLDGITIGRGAIIGAGSVVTKSVGAFEVWGGVPAGKISERPK